MDKILSGLYLGALKDSQDKNQIDKNNITHILSLHECAENGKFEHIKYYCIKVKDCDETDMYKHFRECIEFIHENRMKNGNLLVHCKCGVSRSVTILIAYIMTVTGLSWECALNAVRGARRRANPNDGFKKQLTEFELDKQSENDNLLKRFGEWKNDDYEDCKKLIDSYFAEEEKLSRERLYKLLS